MISVKFVLEVVYGLAPAASAEVVPTRIRTPPSEYRAPHAGRYEDMRKGKSRIDAAPPTKN